MLEGDLPYAVAYPPAFRAEYISETEIRVTTDSNFTSLAHDLNHSREELKIIAEACRGMRQRYGNVLYFSKPERASSFVFRSEREFLRAYSERFAWMVHFYQAAVRAFAQQPERYAGLLFLRPWHVHVGETIRLIKNKKHPLAGKQPEEIGPNELCSLTNDNGAVAPVPSAICEGYLRPPMSLTRSPFLSQCLDFYAEPYGVLPFLSIPFCASSFGAACGHCSAATLFLLSHARTILSPYELAVAASVVAARRASEPASGTQPKMFEISKLRVKDIQNIGSDFCGANVRSHQFFAKKFTQEVEQSFSDCLCTYLYQGIPLLYLVDPEILYSSDDDDTLVEFAQSKRPTDPDRHHIVLLHSLVRLGGGRSHAFVLSDPTDIHRKGDVFHQVSCKRLWAARVQTEPATDLDPALNAPLPAEQESCVATYVACLPEEFTRTLNDVQQWALNRWNTQSIAQRGAPPKIVLRDRSQLRGYLLHQVFQHEASQVSASPTFRDEIGKFREYLRQLDMPQYLWVVLQDDLNSIAQDAHRAASPETPTRHLHGTILDSRSDGPYCISGEFSTAHKRVQILGSDERHTLRRVSIEYTNGRFNAQKLSP